MRTSIGTSKKGRLKRPRISEEVIAFWTKPSEAESSLKSKPPRLTPRGGFHSSSTLPVKPPWPIVASLSERSPSEAPRSPWQVQPDLAEREPAPARRAARRRRLVAEVEGDLAGLDHDAAVADHAGRQVERRGALEEDAAAVVDPGGDFGQVDLRVGTGGVGLEAAGGRGADRLQQVGAEPQRHRDLFELRPELGQDADEQRRHRSAGAGRDDQPDRVEAGDRQHQLAVEEDPGAEADVAGLGGALDRLDPDLVDDGVVLDRRQEGRPAIGGSLAEADEALVGGGGAHGHSPPHESRESRSS